MCVGSTSLRSVISVTLSWLAPLQQFSSATLRCTLWSCVEMEWRDGGIHWQSISPSPALTQPPPTLKGPDAPQACSYSPAALPRAHRRPFFPCYPIDTAHRLSSDQPCEGAALSRENSFCLPPACLTSSGSGEWWRQGFWGRQTESIVKNWSNMHVRSCNKFYLTSFLFEFSLCKTEHQLYLPGNVFFKVYKSVQSSKTTWWSGLGHCHAAGNVIKITHKYRVMGFFLNKALESAWETFNSESKTDK